MMTIVSRTQVHVCDVCVDLRCRNIAVSQQRLNRPRVGAVLQKMSGKAMPQRVWRDVLDSGAFRVTLDHGPRPMPRERLTAMQKDMRQRLLAVISLRRRVLLQPVNRAFAERHSPFFASFAVT